ncbi:MAG: hypothetical protein HY707_02415 [Ignavibacteriae bacterium]|nr:hypothetical protein [Ignavibacteriota bacterium]
MSGCNPCGIEILQKLSGLIDNRELIAYRSNCGATQSYVIHVTFNKPGLNLNSFFFPNDVFASDRGVGLALERISADTVAIHYIALADPYPMVKKLNGIVFIYKSGSEIFSDSLRLLRLRTF